MSNTYYHVVEHGKGIYRIDSTEGVFMDLLIGSKKALLIDTGYGFGNLQEVVDTLIGELPLIVVNTHGHLDHADGNWQFADCEIFMHPADKELYESFYTKESRADAIENAKHAKINWGSDETVNTLPEGFDENMYLSQEAPEAKPICEGDVIDLGGITLKVYEVPGHTKGSIALLNEKTGEMYMGDAANAHVLVVKALGGATIGDYKKTLNKLQGIEFETFLTGHDANSFSKETLADYVDCVENLEKEEYAEMPSPFQKGHVDKMYFKSGYTMQDMQKPGFASLVTDQMD